MSDVAYPRVQAHLARLKLPTMVDCVDAVAQEAAKHDWTYIEFLDQLLDAEVSARYERDVAMKTKLAHFPFMKTLDQFDFAFQPAINERQIRELATMSFIANGENVLFLGPPGVGKTHLAIALGMAAIQKATSVYFITMVDLLDQLRALLDQPMAPLGLFRGDRPGNRQDLPALLQGVGDRDQGPGAGSCLDHHHRCRHRRPGAARRGVRSPVPPCGTTPSSVRSKNRDAGGRIRHGDAPCSAARNPQSPGGHRAS